LKEWQDKLKSHWDSSPAWFIPAAGIGISLLMSLWVWAANDAINVDAIHYIEMADRVKEGGWHIPGGQAFWIYSNLVGIFSAIAGLSSENSAYVINAIFTGTALGILSYVTQKISGDKAVTMAATALLLLNPHFNEYRAYVLRDPGYWMFFAWSLLNLVFYYQTRRPGYAVLWGACLVLASIFRVEAFIYLAFVPVVFLFDGNSSLKKRFAQAFWCYLVPLAGLFLVGILSLSGVLDLNFHGLNYFHQINPVTGLTRELSNRADLLNQYVFNGMSDKQSLLALLAALFMVMGYKIVSVTSLLTFCLAGYSVWLQWGKLYKKYAVLIWYTIISLVVLYGFVLHQYFLQGRYVLSLTFCLSILAAPGLTRIFNKNLFRSQKVNKIVFTITLLWLILMFIDGMWSFGARKHYIKEAGSWVQHNISKNAVLYSNHPVLFYYSGRSKKEQPSVGWLEIENGLKQGHVPYMLGTAKGYMALEIDYKEVTLHQRILDTGKVVLLSSFSNKRGDTAYIYQLK